MTSHEDSGAGGATVNTDRDRIQICRGFTVRQWIGLREHLTKDGVLTNDEAAWQCAVNVFERRIRERYLSCIEALETADSRSDIQVPDDAPADCSTVPHDDGNGIVVPGFAIMALCCLLIETLQSFREAPETAPPPAGPCTYPSGPCIRPSPSTTQAFKDFLKLPAFGGAFRDSNVARSFVNGIRNGILHEAETRRWVIWRELPADKIVDQRGNGYTLNRKTFYRALKQEFSRYVSDLRNPANVNLRKRFVKKMNDIVRES
jgi:hypothetical protein